MKKSSFTLKSIGSEIIILFNTKPLKRISNFKKALKFIALYITQKNIDNFDLFVWEKNGGLVKINDFDPEVMLNHSEGRINNRRNGQVDFSEFMEDDDDLSDLRDGRNVGSRDMRSLMNRMRDNDDDEFNFDDDDDFKGFRDDNFHRRPSRPTWTYTPVDTSQDIENIKKNMKNILHKM